MVLIPKYAELNALKTCARARSSCSRPLNAFTIDDDIILLRVAS